MSVWGPRLLFNLEQIVDRTAAVAITTFLLDAASKRCAALFRMAAGKTISHLGVYCAATVGVPPTCEVRLETVAAGTPTGTLHAPDSRGVFVPTAGVWHWVPLEGPFTPPATGPAAVVVAWSAGPVGGANSATFNFRLSASSAGASPWPASFNGTTWTANPGTVPVLGVRFADGTVQSGLAAIRSVAFTQFGTGSAPNEVGNRFAAPADVTLDGAALLSRLPSGGQATVRILTDSGALLAGIDAQPLEGLRDAPATGTIGVIQVPLAECDLAAETRYLCTLAPLTVAGCFHGKINCADAASRFALFGDAWWIQRTGAGAWSEDQSAVAAIAPRVAAFRSPPTGVLRHPGLCGGLVG